MATMSQVVISEKHRVAINEMRAKIEAETCTAVGETKGAKSNISFTNGIIQNFAKGDLIRPFDRHDFSGKIPGNYPNILNGRNASFNHRGLAPHDIQGSKGGVAYEGKSGPHVATYDIAWVMAWHVPLAGTDNKVYVECGPRSDYTAGVDWTKIEEKLIASDHKSVSKDNKSGAEVAADIDPTETNANLFSVFDSNYT